MNLMAHPSHCQKGLRVALRIVDATMHVGSFFGLEVLQSILHQPDVKCDDKTWPRNGFATIRTKRDCALPLMQAPHRRCQPQPWCQTQFVAQARSVPGLEQGARVACKANMTALNPLLTKVFRGALDLNGPVLGRIFYLFEYARCYIEERSEAFDARFGTDTSAPLFERDQKTSVHFYVPTTASVIYEILNSIPLQANKLVFVDMGSGKGRALLIASEFPFAKIVGIELSHRLHRIAEENVKRYKPASQQCTVFDLKCMDALDYAYGEEPFVLFLFDPFGREILESIIANLEASLRAMPRAAYVVYVYPQYDDLLQKSSVLRKVRAGGPRWQPWSRYTVYATTGGDQTAATKPSS